MTEYDIYYDEYCMSCDNLSRHTVKHIWYTHRGHCLHISIYNYWFRVTNNIESRSRLQQIQLLGLKARYFININANCQKYIYIKYWLCKREMIYAFVVWLYHNELCNKILNYIQYFITPPNIHLISEESLMF